ncbi:phosphoribosylanthranilate isomerase [Magnetococcus marinus MC-1]|uniref:N-(5'-phosphoribosyl)anthranilate isomerase n=1 Tax=Magnetococcus marinus (strain ATCC BAA-1437 / JCM 17883 / MC-1) TaxID=156889 RepID=TRPF_MAGMM|nr:phosphoribosylanthranilate isomerase [Magnetococcus marinus]A0LA38.1 RecName: Full=N-(5'-phosphoribosyl)anthranilate isomerase; Short=PRAI [Magnetococcus marinus MC-1]ABK44831.1 phosphoribosylanthranilate isomerase [Magnetococcus marinus MC-1]
MAVKIKICGITSLADAWAAHDAGADAMGLVFYPGSPRAVTPQQVAQWRGDLPPFMTVVGLFVNATAQWIASTTALCSLDRIQLHGDESPAQCRAWGARAIRAIRVAEAADLHDLARWPVGALLLDAKIKGSYGGTGACFDWQLLGQAELPKPWILAGGLDPDNVEAAVRQVQPYGVDVSSGVESAPGKKDHNKMHRFVAAVRRAQDGAGL